MRHFYLAMAAVTAGLAPASAGDHKLLEMEPPPPSLTEKPRVVERAPAIKHPVPHTMERMGNPQSVAKWARPSEGSHDGPGYVGGATLSLKNIFSHGGGPQPLCEGTFGWDFVGWGHRPGRVFLAPGEPKHPSNFYRGYRTDGPFPFDVFTLRPLRKAVIMKHEAKHPSEEE